MRTLEALFLLLLLFSLLLLLLLFLNSERKWMGALERCHLDAAPRWQKRCESGKTPSSSFPRAAAFLLLSVEVESEISKFPDEEKWSKVKAWKHTKLMETHKRSSQTVRLSVCLSAYVFKQHVCRWSGSKLLPWKQGGLFVYAWVCFVSLFYFIFLQRHEQQRRDTKSLVSGDKLTFSVSSAWLSVSQTLREPLKKCKYMFSISSV